MSVTEIQVINAFHALQAAALALAANERLIDTDTLSRVEETHDLQIYAPALTLTVAALRAQGHPPAIELPSIDPSGPATTGVLTSENCPASLRPLLQRWEQVVPFIQSCDQREIHELCRLLVDLPALNPPLDSQLTGVATQLRALALEIGQRRSFQELFTGDIQAALDYESGRTGTPARTASYRPPPVYDETRPERIQEPAADANLIAIRETLYAALAEALSTSPNLLAILSSTDPQMQSRRPRAYFAAVELAILYVSLNQVDPQRQAVRVVSLGRDAPSIVTEATSPSHLAGIVAALCGIARALQVLREADDEEAVQRAVAGQDEDSERLTQIELLRASLERGDGTESDLTNAIGGLALKISQMPQFAVKQAEVFQLLTGLRPSSPAMVRRSW